MATAFKRSVRAALAGSLLFGGAIVGAVVGGSLPASAQSPVSLYVSSGGSGDCTSQASACGSIQTAITTAQGATYNGDNVTINVAAGTYTENDTVAASSLNALTIAGAGASTTFVNGNQAGTVFTISSGTATISGLTIENGSGTNVGPGPPFPPDYFGGGIYNSGTLSLNSSTVSDNTATSGKGGGIYNASTLSLNSSTVSDNTATGGAGGGIDSYSTVTLSSSTVSDNSAQVGGGIWNEGTLTASATLTNSTISGNTATSNGGGIGAYYSTTTLTDTTVSGNTAPSGSGGGIYSYSANALPAANVSVGATILAANTGGNCLNGPDSTITSIGYNLTDDLSTSNTCNLVAPTDVLGANPQLGPLQNNGGPTQTILPALDSPAIGVIPSSPATTLSSVQVCSRTDQRGVASIGKCTIGAVEGGFLITTTSLPKATPGTAYGPVTLTTQEAGISTSPHVTSLKWKKVSLPKGLKLSKKTGVLSGKPGKKLTAGTSSVKVSVTETVTTLNGKKKVKTKTTVQATIPLTIT